MAETYPLSLPASNIRNVTLRPRFVVSRSESPFSLRGDKQLHSGDRWEIDAVLPAMERADAEKWITWRLRLKGQYGTFLMGDPAARTPLGTLAGSPVSDNAGSPSVNLAGSDELHIRGWSNGATIKAGDYLQVGSGLTARLHKNLTDVTVGPSGTAVHRIFPTLRETLTDGDLITVSNPVGLFELADNLPEWSVDEARIYGLQFSAIESL